MLDTGSSDLWLVTTDCVSATCAGVTRYDAAVSPSLSASSRAFELHYLTGAVRGMVAWDTVVFGAYAIAHQVLALVRDTDALDLAGTGNSGILGLAFARKAAIDASAGAPLLDTVFSQVPEGERFFGVRLAREADGNSSFAMGELDPAVAHRAADIAYSAVFPNARGDAFDYWKLPLRHLSVSLSPGTPQAPIKFALSSSKMGNAPRGANVAVFDTGTTLMLGPASDVARFWALLGDAARYLDKEALWEVRCDRRVGVSLALGGDGGGEGEVREYPVHPLDVSWAGERFGEWCLGGIQPNNHVISGDWLLGDTFLRNVYLTHRPAGNATPPTLGLLSLTDPEAAAREFVAQRGEDGSTPMDAKHAAALARAALRPPPEWQRTLPWLAVSLAAGIALGLAAVLIHAWRNRGALPRAIRRKARKRAVVAG
ncbi:acid protease [Auricularia subglabra TFB-10046 SS5]|nr:acid protease [Auricularia subglabra TFB-10046 SS5]